MNYRHGFHAGNHGDVLKHAALLLLVAYLTAKPKPVFILDTHAGRGLYDLGSPEALRAGEFRAGAARVLAAGDGPAALEPYRAALRRLNPDGNLASYPGSPWLIAQALRTEDRYVGCELHPEESAELAKALRPFRRIARAESRDGYQALKALLPPKERRGLVLIDPPFEQKTEFSDLFEGLATAWKRFPGGAYLVWYPIKDRAAVDSLHDAVKTAGIADATTYELFVRAPGAGSGLAGSGLLAINASYALDADMMGLLPYLAGLLAQGPGATSRMARLTAE